MNNLEIGITMDTIWIIVPVYNVEKYLGKCVKSVQRQTYKNWKMVLVDDGSTDNSGKLCDDFAVRDDRIKVIHTKNCGLPGARRNGLRTVPDNGYCFFCDSDDELPDNALEVLCDKAEETNADFVSGCMVRTFRGIKLPLNQTGQIPPEKKIYAGEEILNDLYIGCFGVNAFLPNLCAKLFKADKLKKVMLDDSRIPKYFAEDLDVTLRLMPMLDKVAFVPDTVYNYRVGGGTSKFMSTFLEDNLFMYNRKKEYMHYYTGKLDAHRLIAIELKNIAMSYFAMCNKFNKFPLGGDLKKEIEAVCALPEIQEAATLIEGDTSGFVGSAEALISMDARRIASVVCAQQENDKGIKAIAKKIIARL